MCAFFLLKKTFAYGNNNAKQQTKPLRTPGQPVKPNNPLKHWRPALVNRHDRLTQFWICAAAHQQDEHLSQRQREVEKRRQLYNK